MSKHNYKQYYNKPAEVKEPIIDEPKQEVTIKEDISKAVEPKLPEPVVEEAKAAEPITGKVVNCKMLNIRKAPRKFADVITVVHADSELVIDLEKSNDDWYAVCTASGVEGFCMKEFVKL